MLRVPRTPRTPRTPLRLAVEATKLAVAGAIAVIAVAPALTQSATVSADQAPGSPVAVTGTGLQVKLSRLMTEHDCSTTGFGPDVIPGSALVERDAQIEHVSFDDGWAVHTGEQSGTLLALCRVNV